MPIPSIEELKAALIANNVLAGRCTVAVFLGLLGEYIILFWTKRKEFSKAEFGLAISAAILIAGGVYGEYFFGSKASDAALGIEKRSEETMALLNLEAGEARDKAGKADERSRQLESNNLVLQAEVLKLQTAASWRTFSAAQHDKLVALAKSRHIQPSMFSIEIDSVVGSPEAKRYGDQLASAITDALELSKPIDKPSGLSACVECTGVWVCVNQNARSDIFDDAKTIQEMLNLSGVTGAKFCTDPKNGQGSVTSVRIIVGPKE